MSAATSGFHLWSIRPCVPASSAGARFGTEVESMDVRERQEARRGAVSGLRSRKRSDLFKRRGLLPDPRLETNPFIRLIRKLVFHCHLPPRAGCELGSCTT